MPHDYKHRLHALINKDHQPVKAAIPADKGGQSGVAVLRLYDPVDSWGGDWGVSAKEFAAALDELPPTTSEIRLHINSPGGEVFEGIAILNALRAHSARVVAVVDGIAASAASFIACGADELVMAENSELMIHDAWGLCVGNAADMRETAGMLDHLSDNIASVYAKKAGTDVAAWRAAMSTETWYSAEEAVAAGLADRVDGAATSEAKNRYDLSIFNYAGRSEAPAPKAAMPDMAEHDFTDPDGDGFCDACVLEDDQGNCTQQCGMTAGLHSMTNAPEDATSPDAAATTTPENAADDEEFQLLASSLEHLSRF